MKPSPSVEKFATEEPNLFANVREWIMDGWGLDLPEGEQFSGPQLAAALLMEAESEDANVAVGETHPSYPIELRKWAWELLRPHLASVLPPQDPREPGSAVCAAAKALDGEKMTSELAIQMLDLVDQVQAAWRTQIATIDQLKPHFYAAMAGVKSSEVKAFCFRHEPYANKHDPAVRRQVQKLRALAPAYIGGSHASGHFNHNLEEWCRDNALNTVIKHDGTEVTLPMPFLRERAQLAEFTFRPGDIVQFTSHCHSRLLGEVAGLLSMKEGVYELVVNDEVNGWVTTSGAAPGLRLIRGDAAATFTRKLERDNPMLFRALRDARSAQ